MSLNISIFESQYPRKSRKSHGKPPLPENLLIFMENAPENPRNYVVNFWWPPCFTHTKQTSYDLADSTLNICQLQREISYCN